MRAPGADLNLTSPRAPRLPRTGGERCGSPATAGDKLPAFLGMKGVTPGLGSATSPSRQDPPGRAASGPQLRFLMTKVGIGHFTIQNYQLRGFFFPPGCSNFSQMQLFDFSVKEILSPSLSLKLFSLKKIIKTRSPGAPDRIISRLTI